MNESGRNNASGWPARLRNTGRTTRTASTRQSSIRNAARRRGSPDAKSHRSAIAVRSRITDVNQGVLRRDGRRPSTRGHTCPSSRRISTLATGSPASSAAPDQLSTKRLAASRSEGRKLRSDETEGSIPGRQTTQGEGTSFPSAVTMTAHQAT